MGAVTKLKQVKSELELKRDAILKDCRDTGASLKETANRIFHLGYSIDQAWKIAQAK